MELSIYVRAQFCDYELSYRPMFENQLGFFEEERDLKFLCCVSDEFEILQEKKPDRDCDEWEKWPLTESIIACIEKKRHLTPRLTTKNLTTQSAFRVFLQKLDNEKNTRSLDC